MNAPYICLRCSRQLLRWKCQRRSSGFVSLGQLVGRDNDSSTKPQEVPLGNGNPTAIEKPPRKKRLTFAQQYQEQRKPKGVDKVLETLFASNRESEQAIQRSRYSRIPKVQSIETAAIERSAIERSIEDRIRELHNKLLRGTAPLQEIWRDCESLLGEKNGIRKDAMVNGNNKTLLDCNSTSGHTSANLRTFHDVLIAICQKQRLVIGGRDLTPADAIETYMKYDVMGHWWHDVLWCQLGHVLQLRYQSTDETLRAASDERMRILLDEILKVWSVYMVFMGRYGLHPTTVSVPLSGDSNDVDDKTWTSEPFLSSLPEQLHIKPTVDITVAAVMTLDCLTAAGTRAPVQIMSLFSRFRRLRQSLQRGRSTATRCLLHAGLSSEITEKALKGWETQSSPEPEEILEPTERPNNSRDSLYPTGKSQKKHDRDWSKNGLRSRLRELEGASNRYDTEGAVSLWRQFQAHLESGKLEDRTDSIDKLYSQFIRTFWALRRHNHAIEVWNHMISSGHQPNQRHWNAMLTGCVVAKDVESLQRIWTNMLRSGMPPDVNNWTTYIHGLIDCHKWEEGLKALETLGRIWKSAPPLKPSDTAADKTSGTKTADNDQNPEEPKDDTVLRPTLQPINGALSALIHIDKSSLIPRVLAWAKSHQLTLSTFTFNILLRPHVRHGSQASIQAHLQQMADANCAPDVATFTIILNGLISNPTSTFHTLPPEAQESTVTSILADMARQGIEPNAHTYGTLLDGLLTPGSKELAHDHTPNVPAARTILAHMAARNIYPSTHIYTILITYYFNRRPLPDLTAISSLWSSIRHSGRANNLDHITFDRLIEGYADHDEIELALKFLRIVPEEGKSPGWYALVRVLRALVRGKEWGLCEELVEDVEREGGLLRYGHGRGQRREQAEFWALVDILRGRGLVGKVDEER